jgi:hypothetical protein
MKLVLPEKDVREAGQVVVLRQGFRVERRACYLYQHVADALVTEMPVSE